VNKTKAVPIDFTNGSIVGWQGLPEDPPKPEIVTMTAIFTYLNATGQSISIRSEATNIYLSAKGEYP
jgi:hypothetical protein